MMDERKALCIGAWLYHYIAVELDELLRQIDDGEDHPAVIRSSMGMTRLVEYRIREAIAAADETSKLLYAAYDKLQDDRTI